VAAFAWRARQSMDQCHCVEQRRRAMAMAGDTKQEDSTWEASTGYPGYHEFAWFPAWCCTSHQCRLHVGWRPSNHPAYRISLARTSWMCLALNQQRAMIWGKNISLFHIPPSAWDGPLALSTLTQYTHQTHGSHFPRRLSDCHSSQTVSSEKGFGNKVLSR